MLAAGAATAREPPLELVERDPARARHDQRRAAATSTAAASPGADGTGADYGGAHDRPSSPRLPRRRLPGHGRCRRRCPADRVRRIVGAPEHRADGHARTTRARTPPLAIPARTTRPTARRRCRARSVARSDCVELDGNAANEPKSRFQLTFDVREGAPQQARRSCRRVPTATAASARRTSIYVAGQPGLGLGPVRAEASPSRRSSRSRPRPSAFVACLRARERAVLDAVRLVGFGAEALVAVDLVVAEVAFERTALRCRLRTRARAWRCGRGTNDRGRSPPRNRGTRDSASSSARSVSTSRSLVGSSSSSTLPPISNAFARCKPVALATREVADALLLIGALEVEARRRTRGRGRRGRRPRGGRHRR